MSVPSDVVPKMEVCCRNREAVNIEYGIGKLIDLNKPHTTIEITGQGSIEKLRDILFENAGGKSMDLIWDEAPPGLGFNDYQEKAASTAIYREGNEGRELFYVALGLAGEAGEVAGAVSKIIRDDKGVLSEEKRKDLIKELGDVSWFLAQTCTELGVTMEQVAQANLDKLASRKERGVLNGSGGGR